MLYLACTTISSEDLAQYGVSLAKDWISVKCGTRYSEPLTTTAPTAIRLWETSTFLMLLKEEK